MGGIRVGDVGTGLGRSLAVALVAALLAACGGGSGDDVQTADGASSTTSTTLADTEPTVEDEDDPSVPADSDTTAPAAPNDATTTPPTTAPPAPAPSPAPTAAPSTTPTAPATTAPTTTVPAPSGHQFAGRVLQQPPPATGPEITLQQADEVSRSVLVAWMYGDRAYANRFASTPTDLDDLFSTRAPSTRFEGPDDENGYCSYIGGAGYTACSYSVVDSSPDGILALGLEVRIVGGRVLVVSGGAADWND